MKLKDQVVSLELAKKLKELGVKQTSLFWWGRDADKIKYSVEYVKNPLWYEHSMYSAYTVAELGEMLPFKIFDESLVTNSKTEHILNQLFRTVGNDDFTDSPYYEIYYSSAEKTIFGDELEANSRAKMLIYLIENKLI